MARQLNEWPLAAAVLAGILRLPCCSASRIRFKNSGGARQRCYDSVSLNTAAIDGADKNVTANSGKTFERFARNSPHTFAGNFNTPTLVIHGQLDRRVPVNHGLELFNVLQNRGVPSKLVYFPDENHWILKPQNSLFGYETSRQWLEKYVRPGPGDASGVSAAPGRGNSEQGVTMSISINRREALLMAGAATLLAGEALPRQPK